MQRLFSMFPDGWPGFGLLVIRVTAGGLLVCNGAVKLLAQPRSGSVFIHSLAAGGGTMLVAGCWTPFAAVLLVLLEVSAVVLGESSIRDAAPLAAIGIALATLGPGRLSFDARRYGRRRVDIK